MAVQGAVATGPSLQGLNDPLAVNDTSEGEAYNELPDWTELYKQYGANATELQLRAEYLREYRKHHENDPEVKYALVIFYSILLVMIGAQSALFWWKKTHQRSYDLVTLLGLWLVPMVISINFSLWRFLVVWSLYTAATGYMLSLCMAKKLAATTPRQVYSWFLSTYMLSVVAGVSGYALLLMDVVAAGAFSKGPGAPLWMTLLMYGTYFGVLGRDAAEMAADRMAANLGTGRRMAVSVRDCGICGAELHDYNGGAEGVAKKEKSVQLACKHLFHDLCIRGWTIVGKKDTCPCCREKVDLRTIFADRPWETRNLNWVQMLDAVRYMVVWIPLILLGFHFVLHWMGVDKHAKQRRALEQHLAELHGNMTALTSGNLTLAALGLAPGPFQNGTLVPSSSNVTL